MIRKFKQIAVRFLLFLQGIKLYRIVAGKLMNGQIHYRIATAEDAPILYRLYKSGGVNESENAVKAYAENLENLASENIGYFATAGLAGRFIGSVVIRRFPGNEELYPGWWIFSLEVGIRYRGLGIGKGLMNTALQKAAEQGAESVKLLVFENNEAAIKLYRKMGFQQVSIPALDAQLEEEVQRRNRRRIIMSLSELQARYAEEEFQT